MREVRLPRIVLILLVAVVILNLIVLIAGVTLFSLSNLATSTGADSTRAAQIMATNGFLLTEISDAGSLTLTIEPTEGPSNDDIVTTETALAQTLLDLTQTADASLIEGTESLGMVQQTATALAQLFDATATRAMGQVGGGDGPTEEIPEMTEEPTAEPTEESMESAEPTEAEMEPTATLVTDLLPTPTPLIVADARLQVRSQLSGEIIGDGVVSVYAPDTVTGIQSARVELELNLANVYITPTPTGDVRSYPVPTRITSTPRAVDTEGNALPTPTPRVLIFEESGLQFYQRMGATLTCPPDTLSGCDPERDLSQSRILLLNRPITTFTWLLRANEGFTGTQEVTVELWRTVENADGDVEFVTEWTYPFTIEVLPPDQENSIGLIVRVAIIVASLLGVLIFSLFDFKPKPKPFRFSRKNTDKPKVFISYRRTPSWATARSVANGLQKRGADVFLDVDDINEGRFAEEILKAIKECDYFVPILTPDTLESEWVRREIETAIAENKPIIPMVMDNFSFYEANLPEGVEELSEHNAIRVTPEYFEEAVDRLASRFMKMEK